MRSARRRSEIIERREENLVGIATGASLAAGGFHASPLIAGVGSAVALAGAYVACAHGLIVLTPVHATNLLCMSLSACYVGGHNF